jgi:pimeloyl-ACP methyl ester carboxylesterase
VCTSSTPRWSSRTTTTPSDSSSTHWGSTIGIPTLVVHGRRDPFFPVGNGEAIELEIPGSRLLVLEEAAIAIPDAAIDEVGEAMLALG